MTPMRILIVEDNPTDRELLRYLLEAKFHTEAKFREADTLEGALAYLDRGITDCVILDLQLPDSIGRDTFRAINAKFPDIPIIVMTNNKDRNIALEMIQEGAADYVLKNYTDEEDVFRRVIFAVEKHRRSVRMSPENVNSIHRVERAKANMLSAHQSGQHSAIRDTTVETTSALADISRKMVSDMASVVAQQGHITQTMDTLNRELLQGHSGRPSMRSQVDLMQHRLTDVEGGLKGLKDDLETAEEAKRKEGVDLQKAHLSGRVKVLLGILTLLGVIATALATYEAGRTKSSTEHAPIPADTTSAPK